MWTQEWFVHSLLTGLLSMIVYSYNVHGKPTFKMLTYLSPTKASLHMETQQLHDDAWAWKHLLMNCLLIKLYLHRSHHLSKQNITSTSHCVVTLGHGHACSWIACSWNHTLIECFLTCLPWELVQCLLMERLLNKSVAIWSFAHTYAAVAHQMIVYENFTC